MQLLGVGRRAPGWPNKSPDRLCRPRLGQDPMSPFPFAWLLPVLVCCCWYRAGAGRDMKMERPGGDGEQILQFPAFPPDIFTRSQLLPASLRSAEARRRVKSIWVLGVRCEGSAASFGQPNEQSLLSLPYLREQPFTAETKTALKSPGHQAIALAISPSFSSKLSLWIYTGPDHCSKVMYLSRGLGMMMSLERNLKTACEFPYLWLRKVKDFLFPVLHIMLTSKQSADLLKLREHSKQQILW